MTGPGNTRTPRASNAMPFRTNERLTMPDRAEGRDGRGRDGGPRGRPMVTVATYPDYLSAQRAVDLLSDNGSTFHTCARRSTPAVRR